MRYLRWFVWADSVVIVLFLLVLGVSERARFVTGGALVNVGFRMQDMLEVFDFEHDHDISPDQVWAEVKQQNDLAARVRKQFPRTARHPLVAMVVCMDARIDTQELVGDTRKYYYVIRTAGSVLGAPELDMVELAVTNGVKVVVLTTHSDCAAEATAADPVRAAKFPSLAAAVHEREDRVRELLARPLIADRVAKGALLIKRVNIDTLTEELLMPGEATRIAPAPLHDEPATH